MTAIIKDLNQVIEETRKYLGGVRQVLIKVAANLHFLRENDNRPWAEVCEDLDISQGFSSKLISVYQHFILEGGIDPSTIADIDAEKLYLSQKTQGSVDEQIARARTLTRGELKIERQENDPCAHENHGDCCYDCWTKLG